MRKLAIGTALLAMVVVACAQEPERQAQPPQQEPAGSQEITVTAKEYAFGVKPAPTAGRTAFILENLGEQPHEFGLVRITGEQTIEELIRLPQNESNQYIEEVGHAFAKRGSSDTFTRTLEVGRYGYACFVRTKAAGKPHAFLGMHGEFTVE